MKNTIKKYKNNQNKFDKLKYKFSLIKCIKTNFDYYRNTPIDIILEKAGLLEDKNYNYFEPEDDVWHKEDIIKLQKVIKYNCNYFKKIIDSLMYNTVDYLRWHKKKYQLFINFRKVWSSFSFELINIAQEKEIHIGYDLN